MAGFPYGAQVADGKNAVAQDHNNGRKDGLTRWLKFEVLGTLVTGNTQGGTYLLPFAGSVVQTYMITDSGTATLTLTKNRNGSPVTMDSGMSASSSSSVDTVVASPNFVVGDTISLDITAVSSGVHLIAMVEVLPTP